MRRNRAPVLLHRPEAGSVKGGHRTICPDSPGSEERGGQGLQGGRGTSREKGGGNHALAM